MRQRIVVFIAAFGIVSGALAVMALLRAPDGIDNALQASLSAQSQSREESDVRSSGACSNRTLRGRYGFSGTGTVEGFGTVVNVGVVTFDGDGKLRLADTASIKGEIFERTAEGTYRVGANCRATATVHITVPAPLEAHIRLVIVDDGEAFHFMQSDPGAAFSGTGHQQ